MCGCGIVKLLRDEKMETGELTVQFVDDSDVDSIEDIEDLEEAHYIKNDPIRRHQFDYGKSACLVDSHPEGNLREVCNEQENLEQIISIQREPQN